MVASLGLVFFGGCGGGDEVASHSQPTATKVSQPEFAPEKGATNPPAPEESEPAETETSNPHAIKAPRRQTAGLRSESTQNGESSPTRTEYNDPTVLDSAPSPADIANKVESGIRKEAEKKSPPKRSQVRSPRRPQTAVTVGDEILDITGKDIDGVEFSLSEYRGKVMMIDFWGDW